jgi:hypothetical protein
LIKKIVVIAALAAAVAAADVSAGGITVVDDTGAVLQTDNFAYYERTSGLLLSLRNEVLAVMGEISTVGLNFEVGLVDRSGFFISADFGGGINYYGVGINVGYSFDSYDRTTHVVGLSGNYHHTDLVARFVTSDGVLYAREVGTNRGYGSIFWKVIPGETKYLDVTNRFLFGYKHDSAWYDYDRGEIIRKSGFSAAYSFTLGFTLIKRSK